MKKYVCRIRSCMCYYLPEANYINPFIRHHPVFILVLVARYCFTSYQKNHCYQINAEIHGIHTVPYCAFWPLPGCHNQCKLF